MEKGAVQRHDRAPIALLVMLVMVLAAALTPITIMTAALLAVMAMIGLRCCTTHEARKSVDWGVLLVIGAAIGIGNALDKSGTATAIARGLLMIANGNPFLSLAAVYLATMLCTELITNTAAAVLMLKIGLSTATSLAASGQDVSETPFVIAVMIAASASFLTPFGYQTNLMVYGVGGYRVTDYLKFGLPLSMIVFAVAMVVIPNVWPLMLEP